ncbi:MAG: alpha/beta fold hydrolase [Candidatus Heimdallarchaeota archaeon]
MLDHNHHFSKSLAIKLLSLETSDLNQKCYLNVETTDYESDRSTLLLLHGYLGTSQDYHKFFHTFNNFYNIIACDLRGHGKSDNCTNPYNTISWTISDFAADIYQIVTQTVDRGDKVIVIASSLSTAIALQLAANYPEIVESMFLISPTCKFKILKWTNILLFFEQILPEKVMHRMTMVISNLLIKLSTKQKDPPKRERRIRGIKHFQKIKWTTHRKILTQALKLWSADVSIINHPVFIVAGIEDNVVPYEDSVQIHRLIRNSALLTIHSKHQILITRVKLITNILEQWLKDYEAILLRKFICADNLVMINNNFRIPLIKK